MNDQEIKLVIKSLWDNAGTNKSLGDLRLLVEATEQGSKEAGAALDEWRAKYGKLKDTLTYSGPNAGLATAPNMGGTPPPPRPPPAAAPAPAAPPPGGEEDELSSAMRGQIGSAIGQATGVPGLGTAGRFGALSAAIAAAGYAIAKVTQSTKDWFAEIQKAAQAALLFENVGATIESVTSKTRQLEIHNRELAATYNRITENVHSVAAEIAHLNEYQQTQLTMQARVASAQMEAELARNALQNRFSPIERIQNETRIREEALQRQIAQEQALDRQKERLHEEDARRSMERLDMYRSQAEASRERIKLLEREAELAGKQAADVSKSRDTSTAALEEEMALLKDAADGKAGPGAGAKYRYFRNYVNKTASPDTAGTEAITGFGTAGLTQRAAEARMEEIRQQIAENERAKQDARDVTRNKQGALDREKSQASFAEGKVLGLKDEAETATYRAEQQRKLNEEKALKQAEELRLQQEANRQRGELEILNQFHPASLSPTGGGASVDPQMQRNNELLERVVMALEGQA